MRNLSSLLNTLPVSIKKTDLLSEPEYKNFHSCITELLHSAYDIWKTLSPNVYSLKFINPFTIEEFVNTTPEQFIQYFSRNYPLKAWDNEEQETAVLQELVRGLQDIIKSKLGLEVAGTDIIMDDIPLEKKFGRISAEFKNFLKISNPSNINNYLAHDKALHVISKNDSFADEKYQEFTEGFQDLLKNIYDIWGMVGEVYSFTFPKNVQEFLTKKPSEFREGDDPYLKRKEVLQFWDNKSNEDAALDKLLEGFQDNLRLKLVLSYINNEDSNALIDRSLFKGSNFFSDDVLSFLETRTFDANNFPQLTNQQHSQEQFGNISKNYKDFLDDIKPEKFKQQIIACIIDAQNKLRVEENRLSSYTNKFNKLKNEYTDKINNEQEVESDEKEYKEIEKAVDSAEEEYIKAEEKYIKNDDKVNYLLNDWDNRKEQYEQLFSRISSARDRCSLRDHCSLTETVWDDLTNRIKTILGCQYSLLQESPIALSKPLKDLGEEALLKKIECVANWYKKLLEQENNYIIHYQITSLVKRAIQEGESEDKINELLYILKIEDIFGKHKEFTEYQKLYAIHSAFAKYKSNNLGMPNVVNKAYAIISDKAYEIMHLHKSKGTLKDLSYKDIEGILKELSEDTFEKMLPNEKMLPKKEHPLSSTTEHSVGASPDTDTQSNTADLLSLYGQRLSSNYTIDYLEKISKGIDKINDDWEDNKEQIEEKKNQIKEKKKQIEEIKKQINLIEEVYNPPNCVNIKVQKLYKEVLKKYKNVDKELSEKLSIYEKIHEKIKELESIYQQIEKWKEEMETLNHLSWRESVTWEQKKKKICELIEGSEDKKSLKQSLKEWKEEMKSSFVNQQLNFDAVERLYEGVQPIYNKVFILFENLKISDQELIGTMGNINKLYPKLLNYDNYTDSHTLQIYEHKSIKDTFYSIRRELEENISKFCELKNDRCEMFEGTLPEKFEEFSKNVEITRSKMKNLTNSLESTLARNQAETIGRLEKVQGLIKEYIDKDVDSLEEVYNWSMAYIRIITGIDDSITDISAELININIEDKSLRECIIRTHELLQELNSKKEKIIEKYKQCKKLQEQRLELLKKINNSLISKEIENQRSFNEQSEKIKGYNHLEACNIFIQYKKKDEIIKYEKEVDECLKDIDSHFAEQEELKEPEDDQDALQGVFELFAQNGDDVPAAGVVNQEKLQEAIDGALNNLCKIISMEEPISASYNNLLESAEMIRSAQCATKIPDFVLVTIKDIIKDVKVDVFKDERQLYNIHTHSIEDILFLQHACYVAKLDIKNEHADKLEIYVAELEIKNEHADELEIYVDNEEGNKYEPWIDTINYIVHLKSINNLTDEQKKFIEQFNEKVEDYPNIQDNVDYLVLSETEDKELLNKYFIDHIENMFNSNNNIDNKKNLCKAINFIFNGAETTVGESLPILSEKKASRLKRLYRDRLELNEESKAYLTNLLLYLYSDAALGEEYKSLLSCLEKYDIVPAQGTLSLEKHCLFSGKPQEINSTAVPHEIHPTH